MNNKQKMGFMKAVFMLTVVLSVVAVSIFSAPRVSAQTPKGPVTPQDVAAIEKQVAGLATNQVIVQYRFVADAFVHPDTDTQMKRLSQAAGMQLQYARAMSGDAHVLRLPGKMALEQVKAIAASLAALPEVASAEPDQIMYHTIDPTGDRSRRLLLTPNDSLFANQWDMKVLWGINAPAAWNITTGASTVVMANLDTGITSHPEFTGRTVQGYDFIDDALVGNDGNGRDNNPSDPGDWITAADSSGATHGGWFYGCPIDNSSWHGTHTIGTMGATGNNGSGIAGVNWNSKILPIRVLGKCGGYLSDIADAIRWAAGLSVSGVPTNANPARVLNLSLGGYGMCGATYQAAINQATAAGAVVVVSAGNSADNAANYRPANCNGVITVAATGPTGDLSYYSNFGNTVEISAPGGEMSFTGDTNGVISTLNTGTTVPGASSYVYYQGTSMAAPHITGVVSLLFSLNPALTPAQVLQILQNSAKTFGGSVCDITICGKGIVDANAALDKPIIAISGNAGAAGATLTYTDGSLKTVTAKANGDYSFLVSYNFTGTVTVSRVGYTYTIDHIDYTNVTSNQTNQNYTANQSVHTISGNAGVASATISYNDGSPQTTTTNSSGDYSLLVPDGFNSMLTPSKVSITFTPASIDYSASPVTADLTDQDFMPSMTFTSSGSEDGWVLESTETSNVGGTINNAATVFNLGDDASNRQYRAIVSFNTAGLPDNAVVQSAVLKIKQNGAFVGTNPFSTLLNIWADIRNGPFGTAMLQTGDFNAAATATKVSNFSPTPVNAWYSNNLGALGLSNIHKTSITQFRLYFAKDDNNNSIADYVKFVSGNAPSNQPVLIVTFTLP